MSLAGRLSKRFIARKQMFASKISAIYGVMSSVINNTIPALHINSRKEKKKIRSKINIVRQRDPRVS